MRGGPFKRLNLSRPRPLLCAAWQNLLRPPGVNRRPRAGLARELGAKWIKRIEAPGKKKKDWLDDVEKASKAFTGENKAEDGSTLAGDAYDFNILYSNVETIVPAIINSPPSPDVRRHGVTFGPCANRPPVLHLRSRTCVRPWTW